MNEILELSQFRDTMTDDPAARARARNRLVSRILHKKSPRIQRRLTRRVVVATAAAAVAAGGLIVADSVVVRDEPVGASAEAATLLNQAADRAIGSTDPVVGPDEYLHITTVAVSAMTVVASPTGVGTWLVTYTDELFVPGNPATEWVLRRSPHVPYRAEDATLAAEHGMQEGMPGFTERATEGAFFGEPQQGEWGTPTPEFLASLPRHPEQLLDQIRTHAGDAGPSPDGEALVVIADTLRTGFVPGDLRAALFQAAALIPGVELIDEQANLNGQVGVAVGRYEPNNGERQEIIFDPETGAMIGERDVLVDRGNGPLLPAGTAPSWTAVTTDVVPASMVDEIPADPME